MFDGKAMRSARRALRLTGRELARRVGVTNVTISRIENARQAPSRDLAERISSELGVDVRALYTEGDLGRGLAMPEMSNEEREILAAYRRLGPIAQAKTWAFVMGLASSGSSEGAATAAELAHAAETARRAFAEQEGKHAKRA